MSTAAPAESLRIQDPTYTPSEDGGVFTRAANALINDPRDVPFVGLMAWSSLVLIPFAVFLYLPGRFHWAFGAAYLVVNVAGFIDRYTLMLHNTSHRKLFKSKFKLLNAYIPWVLGPLFGQSPETYYAHHLGMHHPENNLREDLSSTMRFQRDSFAHWLRYFTRFIALGPFELPLYLRRKKRKTLMYKAFLCELGFYAVLAGLMFVNWRATLIVFVAPFALMRILMMCGNWGQHAFIDAARPENAYVNSITCINTRYNRRCFNDGYHIGHHVRASRHWSEMPGDFETNVAKYAEEGAIVFEGIDFFQVWLFLMLKRYDWLAARYVHLGGAPKSRDEIVALLRERTRAIPV